MPWRGQPRQVTSGFGKKEIVGPPNKSDSGGMRKVRRQLEWVERTQDEKGAGTLKVFQKFCCEGKQKNRL